QAEDGIRDFHVTGVQTCALPISGSSSIAGSLVGADAGGARPHDRWRAVPARPGRTPRPCYLRRPTNRSSILDGRHEEPPAPEQRSEERRVGKEWRAGGSAWQWDT